MSFIKQFKQKQNKFELFLKITQDLLLNNQIADDVKYYLDKRINKIEDQKLYGFGYFPNDDNVDLLLNKGLSTDDYKELCLLYDKSISGGKVLHGHFCDHNLILPVRDEYNNIVSFIGRADLTESQLYEKQIQKYKYTGNNVNAGRKDLYLFGLNIAKPYIIEKNCVICVEGQFDCIALQTAGIKNVVAVGNCSLSIYKLFKLYRYTKNIILMFDNDKPGKTAHQKIKEKYSCFGVNVKTAAIPEGFKDIDEFLNKEKDEDYKVSVISKMNAIRF